MLNVLFRKFQEDEAIFPIRPDVGDTFSWDTFSGEGVEAKTFLGGGVSSDLHCRLEGTVFGEG